MLCCVVAALHLLLVLHVAAAFQARAGMSLCCGGSAAAAAPLQEALLDAEAERAHMTLANITLSIPMSSVLLVDSPSSLNIMCSRLREHARTAASNLVLGVDCEWKPEGYRRGGGNAAAPPLGKKDSDSLLERLWRTGRRVMERRVPDSSKHSSVGVDKREKPMSQPVLVLQLATRDAVFIIDLQQLLKQSDPGQAAPPLSEIERSLDGICAEMFHSRSIIKVGLGPQQDLKRLSWSYSHLPSLRRFCSVLDISSLAKRRLPGVSGKSLEGLAKLCRLVLNSSVDKSEQCSSWHVRPLSVAQLTYAAIDAHVLTILYDELLAGDIDALSLCNDYSCGGGGDAAPAELPVTLRGFTFTQRRSVQ